MLDPTNPSAPIIEVKALPVVATWLEIVKAFTDGESARVTHAAIIARRVTRVRKLVIDVAKPVK